MEAEKKAAAFYADAAQKTETLGRSLLEQLAEFERHHYAIMAKLEQSLRDQGAFMALLKKGLSNHKGHEGH